MEKHGPRRGFPRSFWGTMSVLEDAAAPATRYLGPWAVVGRVFRDQHLPCHRQNKTRPLGETAKAPLVRCRRDGIANGVLTKGHVDRGGDAVILRGSRPRRGEPDSWRLTDDQVETPRSLPRKISEKNKKGTAVRGSNPVPPRIFFPFFHGLRLLGPFAFFIFCPGRLVSPDSAARRCTSSRALPARVTDMDRGGGGVFPHYLHH